MVVERALHTQRSLALPIPELVCLEKKVTTSVQGLQATTGYTSLLSSEATTGYTSLLSSEATTGYICFWPAIKGFHPLECAHWVCAAAVRPKVFYNHPAMNCVFLST